jgi:hypothetical protein
MDKLLAQYLEHLFLSIFFFSIVLLNCEVQALASKRSKRERKKAATNQ